VAITILRDHVTADREHHTPGNMKTHSGVMSELAVRPVAVPLLEHMIDSNVREASSRIRDSDVYVVGQTLYLSLNSRRNTGALQRREDRVLKNFLQGNRQIIVIGKGGKIIVLQESVDHTVTPAQLQLKDPTQVSG
jgi:hypothetical protein